MHDVAPDRFRRATHLGQQHGQAAGRKALPFLGRQIAGVVRFTGELGVCLFTQLCFGLVTLTAAAILSIAWCGFWLLVLVYWRIAAVLFVLALIGWACRRPPTNRRRSPWQ
jgi:hypothetical protein